VLLVVFEAGQRFGNLFKITGFDQANGHSPLWTEYAPFATSRLTLVIMLAVRARAFNASLTPATTDGKGVSDFGP